jgi:replicative DNA helicase
MNNLPPHNIELEESVLATILAHPEDDLFELMPVDFYKSANACVYRICLGLWNAKLPVDISSVGNELKKNDTEVPLSYLSTLMDAPPIISTEYSVNQIRGFANLRRMIELSNSLMKQCYRAKPEDVENIVDNLQRDSLKIGTTKTENLVSIGSIITDAVEHCELIAQQSGITGIPTGYNLLDSLLCGFQPSDLIVLAGRPGMGKTAMAVNCMINSAKKEHPNDFYSLEMARMQIGLRFLTVESRVDSQRLRSGRLTAEDWQQLTDGAGQLYKLPINIDDTACATYQEIQRKARKSKKQNNTGIIWIDYLSFLDGDKEGGKVAEIETITRGLKSLAKELNIPIVLLCQLNRMCEQRKDKRPILSDLRDSGAIEQDADVVLFLYRDEVYNHDEDNPEKGMIEVDVAKQRNGPTGRIKLSFLNSFTRFENLARWEE